MTANKDKLNVYAMAVEEAQTDIRVIIKQAYLTREDYGAVISRLTAVINKAVRKINIATLQQDAAVSLWLYARQQRRIWQSMGLPPEITLFLGLYAAKGFKVDKSIEHRLSEEYRRLQVPIMGVGVPLRKYYKDVWEKDVKPALDDIVKQKALDPNDYTGRNSLRNLAEMEARYKEHEDNITELRERNVKLVVCSSHADCSDRCAPWQGRIYSLDGSAGEIDGHKYVPLEVATDIWYTTKAGRRYKNGLLGFNCRHYLSEYKGALLPTITSKERKKEYKITVRQRELEREVRRYEAEALTYKVINKTVYKEAKAKSRAIYEEYIRYSVENERAYYPSRTDL